MALDHFEAAVSRAMARFQPVVGALSHEGKLLLPHREVLLFIWKDVLPPGFLGLR